MANKIILKKTSTASKVPLATDLEVGEIAVNLADQKLYSKNAGGTVILVGQGVAGSGDVVGGSSSTDNALARYDGTTGKLIENSTAILDDSGNLDTASIKTDYADLDTGASAPTYAQGRTFWDSGNGTTSTYLNPDVTLQNGQEIVTLVYNGTGSTITNGSVVAVVGAQGQRPSVALADADSEPTSASTLGIATQDIANGAEGFITSFGFIRGVDTSAFTAGAPIYLSQTAGGFTATRPSAPAHTVILGWVIKVNASSGEIFVHINNGWELDELHNVLITSPTSGNTLIYDAVAGVWENANITGGTGLSVTNGAGTIALANTGVTSAVAGTGISVSSATGAVTVTNSDRGSSQNIFKNIAVSGQSTVVADSNDDTVTLANGTGITITTNATTDTITVTNAGVTSVNGVTGAVTATNLLDAIKTVDGAGSGLDADTLDGNSSAFFYPASNPNGYTTNTGTVTSVSATAGTGISVSGSPITTSGTLTITNTAPDQTVSLTQGGATTITGTYPNFTISSVNTTYSPATSTVAGLIELGSDTVQTVASNAVSATASRSYGLQVNASGQGVINVPWTDTVYTLPTATTTVLGGIELGSDTVQTVAPNAVTATASRSYALQLNSAGQAVVNVPWTDTNSGGTVTSITAGTGLSGGTITTSGTIALANTSVTAGSYTTANITVDAQGRITSASNGSGGGVQRGSQYFTTSGTFTVPTGVTAVNVTVVGAGGNGGAQNGAGGSGGGLAMGTVTGLTSGGTVTVTVGTNASRTSSFGAFMSATGGTNASTATGGTGSGGSINIIGGKGGQGGDNRGGGGGASGGGAGANYGYGGAGGAGGGGPFGSGGTGNNFGTSANTAPSGYGNGGGAGTSVAGTLGLVIVGW